MTINRIYDVDKAIGLIESVLLKNENVTIYSHRFADTDALMSSYLLEKIAKESNINAKVKFILVEDYNKICENAMISGERNFIGTDFGNDYPMTIGHEHLSDKWSASRLVYEAILEIPELSKMEWLVDNKPLIEFLVDYCSRGEQRVLTKEERSKTSFINLLYGLRSQQDLIDDDALYTFFRTIVDSALTLFKDGFVSENDFKFNINKIVENSTPQIYNQEPYKTARENLKLTTFELIDRSTSFKTLENGLKVAINRSCYNLIHPLFSEFEVDIIIFENKYRRIGIIFNKHLHFNSKILYDFLKEDDNDWKFVPEISLISKKVKIEDFDQEKSDKLINKILSFLNTIYIKDQKKTFKKRRISHFE